MEKKDIFKYLNENPYDNEEYTNIAIESYPDFVHSFKENIRKISYKTLKLNGDVDEDLLDSDICWMVTMNLVELISVKKESMKVVNTENLQGSLVLFLKYIKNELSLNKLLIFIQDYGVDDHYFAVIGYHGYALIIEWNGLNIEFNSPILIDDFIIEIRSIIRGAIPDRFYGVKKQHTMEVQSYFRKELKMETIDDYLYSP